MLNKIYISTLATTAPLILSQMMPGRFPGQHPSGGPQVRRFNSLVSMAYTQVNTSYNRNEFEDRIKRYGCHCFPGTNTGENGVERHSAIGQGKTVDEIDSVCKRLAKCHHCIQLKYGADAIDVNNGRYHWSINDDTRALSCDKNKDEARKALCECDASFAVEMGNTWQDKNWNSGFWLNNRNQRQSEKSDENWVGDFDYDNTCQKKGAKSNKQNFSKSHVDPDHAIVADKCCGVGFEPYDSKSKKCCESSGKVYNPDLFQCCASGEVKSFGSC